MTDGVVGRMLVASLHQGIVDVHPARLEFYEGWLNPAGLRDGRIGLAPLAAVLSFLRQEGEPYDRVAGRAGEYTAEWTVLGLTPFHRAALRQAPPSLRARLALRVARSMVRATSRSTRTVVRWRQGQATMDLRGSIFCDVRERTAHPLCAYYASAIRHLLTRLDLDADLTTAQCRATGGGHCVMSIRLRTGT